jgi:glycosyltransferase involved in cell wall biosynthesis
MVSVIIPSYKAVKYIDECLNSIQGAEILVGVDGCQETFNHLKNRSDIRLFYFTKNVGPYVIKNTLIDEASNEHILFFDSDDVLVNGVIQKVDNLLDTIDYVKLNYINFENRFIPNNKTMMNDAVIAINRSVFNRINGFQPWRCAADTELSHRLEHNNISYKLLDGLAYKRRLHGENLTMKKETGHNSPLRKTYIEYINKYKRMHKWPNPLTKTTSSYVTY